MDGKSIQKKRTMAYFIDAVDKIISEEGIEQVTLRKVAKTAGYNSATLYNYFDNLEHLLIFASMKHLKIYNDLLPTYLNSANNAVERYLSIWRCFCHCSFRQPKIYTIIFLSEFSNSLNSIIKNYYEIFPEELEAIPILENIFLQDSLSNGNTYMLSDCVKEGYIDKNDVSDISDMSLLLYKSMINDILNHKLPYDIETAEERIIRYFEKILNSYILI